MAYKRANHSALGTPWCQEPSCSELREKGRRYCAGHGGIPRQPRVRIEGTCLRCGTDFGFYESQVSLRRDDIRDFYRQACSACRHRVLGQVRSHHLDSHWSMRLLFATACDLCGERPSAGRGGQLQFVVDHDHTCCEGPNSCGLCVRGLLCQGCNIRIGAVEHVLRVGDLEAILAYIKRDQPQSDR